MTKYDTLHYACIFFTVICYCCLTSLLICLTTKRWVWILLWASLAGVAAVYPILHGFDIIFETRWI